MKIDFNTLIEKFNQLDIKLRYGVFGVILLLIFLLDSVTIMGFQYHSLQKMEDANQTLKADMAKLKADLQRRDQMNKGLTNSQDQLQAMNMKIHSNQEVSAVLAEISQTANETGLTINRLIPQSQGQQESISTPNIKYYALPIVVEANSSYHTFGHFLNQLELDKMLFTLKSLDIQNQDNDTSHLSIHATLGVIFSETKSPDGHKT